MKRTIGHISTIHYLSLLGAALLIGLPTAALAADPFISGSTCATSPDPPCLGAFNPTLNTEITLPPDGILHYSTFTVPAGVTVTFKKNAANTPVTILASGNVTINGSINLNGTSATAVGTAGDGVLGDDGQPGLGGPGGYDGGMGGLSPLFGGSTGAPGGAGKGPGGGTTGGDSPCTVGSNNNDGCGGGSASFGSAANGGYWNHANGTVYGQATLLPLIGGSGGAGGNAGRSFNGGGGGGGGGAILIASSGTIAVAGNIVADGGAGGPSGGSLCGGSGGAGSGGAIRLVAQTLTRSGSGVLYARGGGSAGSCNASSGAGGAGYVRIESNNITGWATGNSNPGNTYALAGRVFVPNNPTLAITSVAGVPVPPNPTGVADISLPAGTTMPVAVTVAGTNIPVGTPVRIYLVRSSGNRSEVAPIPALAGSEAASTATANVTFLSGNTTLLASATYTVTEIIAASLPKFNGEYVAKIRVEGELGGASRVIYITASGKEYPADTVPAKAAS